ncbi:hypothetical protein [Acaryochloris thomasi]|uniref:hypothetical protein n=1 Tax=Acaryochloris thomasi TaxID=2929456 RepID=UPI000DA6AE35|nr:hypothetical protein [Acaryochloris thomasi]
MLLSEMSRVSPDSPAYEKLLEQLKRLSKDESNSEDELRRQRLNKRLQAISHINQMPVWFQVIFILSLLYLIVLFIDASGFWFGYDFLNNNPPPVQSSLMRTPDYRYIQQAPSIP